MNASSPLAPSQSTAAPPSAMKPAEDRLVESVVEVDMADKATVGVTLSTDNPVKITKLLPTSHFLGKLFVGDLVLTVNDVKINNTGDFFKATNKPGKLAIRIKRDEYCTCKVNVLPAPKPGMESFEFEMNWRTGGMPIGILVYQDSEKRVIVSMIESGTLASQTLKPGDHLTKVNDVLIPDKAVAKKMIVESVNAKNKVKLTVDRQIQAATPAAPASTPPCAAQNPKMPNYDLALPPDVLAIMEANKAFHKAPFELPSIVKLAPPVSSPAGSRINMPEVVAPEDQIEFDPSPKPLKTTPKRVGAA